MTRRTNNSLEVIVQKLEKLRGTFKTKKSMLQLMKEIDQGWDP